MKHLCVIGDPIAHSLSPTIQNALLLSLHLPYFYEAVEVKSHETAAFLTRAKGGDWAGFNATMPHKTALVPLLDELTADAARCGAVNAVRLRDGRAVGDNTDGRGFLQSLPDSPAGKNICLLGAGGAARALAVALTEAGARVTVCCRTPAKGEALAALCPGLRATDFSAKALSVAAGETDLLVNATPLGMTAPFPTLTFLSALRPGVPVCDLIYQPAETALLAAARRGGHPTQNGSDLLLHQAILSLSFFLDCPIDPAAALPVAQAALAQAMEEGGR
ncbi:MAG: shikimate dehydrogenase [Oscillospiraceae bacterium]